MTDLAAMVSGAIFGLFVAHVFTLTKRVKRLEKAQAELERVAAEKGLGRRITKGS